MVQDSLSRVPRHLPFDDHPLLAIWELTQACDLACVHCRACAKAERDDAELTTSEGKHLLERIAAMGTRLVVLTGGDPAKRPDLVELIARGARVGLVMAVTPSGTALMTRDLLRSMSSSYRRVAQVYPSCSAPAAWRRPSRSWRISPRRRRST